MKSENLRLRWHDSQLIIDRTGLKRTSGVLKTMEPNLPIDEFFQTFGLDPDLHNDFRTSVCVRIGSTQFVGRTLFPELPPLCSGMLVHEHELAVHGVPSDRDYAGNLGLISYGQAVSRVRRAPYRGKRTKNLGGLTGSTFRTTGDDLDAWNEISSRNPHRTIGALPALIKAHINDITSYLMQAPLPLRICGGDATAGYRCLRLGAVTTLELPIDTRGF
jgi:hypothetical protein